MYSNNNTTDITTHKGKTINPTNRSDLFSEVNSILLTGVDEVTIPPGYAHRPDLISNEVFQTVRKDWLILMINNIKDPFQELNAGDSIIIPKT